MSSTTEAPKPPLCFVVGPIGKDGSPERKHADLLLQAVIKEVLGGKEFGYRVKRADEDAGPGMIGDRMISDIIHAELVVADLTDLNPNAFYELGIRHSTEKPTIHVAKFGIQLPFDNVAHHTIFIDLAEWQSIERGRAQLAASARAIKEPGYQVSNPITQANASFKMRESADPRERVIAELQERVRAIELRPPAFVQTGSEDNRVFPVRSFGEISGLIQAGLVRGDPPLLVASNVTNIISQEDSFLVLRLFARPDDDKVEFGLFRDDRLLTIYLFPK
jgi:hypothetical protein